VSGVRHLEYLKKAKSTSHRAFSTNFVSEVGPYTFHQTVVTNMTFGPIAAAAIMDTEKVLLMLDRLSDLHQVDSKVGPIAYFQLVATYMTFSRIISHNLQINYVIRYTSRSCDLRQLDFLLTTAILENIKYQLITC